MAASKMKMAKPNLKLALAKKKSGPSSIAAKYYCARLIRFFDLCLLKLVIKNAHRIGKDIPTCYYSFSYIYNKRLTPIEQFQSQFVDNKRKKWKDKEKSKDGNFRFVILNNLVQFEILEFKKIDEDFFKGKTPYKVRKVPEMNIIKDFK